MQYGIPYTGFMHICDLFRYAVPVPVQYKKPSYSNLLLKGVHLLNSCHKSTLNNIGLVLLLLVEIPSNRTYSISLDKYEFASIVGSTYAICNRAYLLP